MEDKKILYVALALVGGIMVGYMTGGSNISIQDQGASSLSSQTARNSIVNSGISTDVSINTEQDSRSASLSTATSGCPGVVLNSQNSTLSPYISSPITSGSINNILKIKIINGSTCTLKIANFTVKQISSTGAQNITKVTNIFDQTTASNINFNQKLLNFPEYRSYNLEITSPSLIIAPGATHDLDFEAILINTLVSAGSSPDIVVGILDGIKIIDVNTNAIINTQTQGIYGPLFKIQ